jgi:hypothetical protein
MMVTESFQLQLDDLLDRICVKLQISPTQYKAAEDHYSAIGKWLGASGSSFEALKPEIYSQGSIRIGTTVKPRGRNEFDLDLVCQFLIDPRQVPDPVARLNAVETRLRQNDQYKNILERKNRCIRVKYANAFHLDILPACPDPSKSNGCIVVPDRALKGWTPSNPIGYADWFEGRARSYKEMREGRLEPLPDHETVDEKAPLKCMVQLIKRWRDIAYASNMDEAPISIVLTTLAGQYYARESSLGEGLSGILRRIVENLPAPGDVLVVRNPANSSEVLSEKWNQTPALYAAFTRGITEFVKTWDSIRSTGSIPAVTKILERLFGEEIARTVVAEQAESIQATRNAGKLQVRNSSGLIGSLGGSKGTLVQRNTFHGSKISTS